MTRFVTVILLFLICMTRVVAQDAATKNAVDEVETKLKDAKRSYLASVQDAHAGLLAAFENQKQTIESDKRQSVSQKVKLLEELQKEKSEFEADPERLPKGMLPAVREFRRKVTEAKKECEPTFDEAAEVYVKNQDLVSAKAVLAEKTRFLNRKLGDDIATGFILDTWVSGLGDVRGVTVGRGGAFGTVPVVYSVTRQAVLRVTGKYTTEVFAKGFAPKRSGRIVIDSKKGTGAFGGDMFVSSPADGGDSLDLIYRVGANGTPSLFHSAREALTKGIALGGGTGFGDFLYVVNATDRGLLRVDGSSTASAIGTGVTCDSWEDDMIMTTGEAFGENAYLTDGVHGKILLMSPAGKVTVFASIPAPVSIAQGDAAFGEFLYVGTYNGSVFRVSRDGEVTAFLSGFGVHSPEGNFRGIDISGDQMWITTDTGDLLRVTPVP